MAIRNGGPRADTLFGTVGSDRLYGGGGSDVLYGGRTSDWNQVDGDDTLDGGPGSDRIYGGYGDDFIFASAGSDYVHGGAGNDTIDYSRAKSGMELTIGDFAFLNSGAAEGHEVIEVETVIGTRFADQIQGLSNQGSTLSGGGGADLLYGGYVADRLVGGGGRDSLYGDMGDDRLYGGGGADTLYGEEGQDRLYGGAGGDLLYGGDGGFFVPPAADTLYGGGGRDRLVANGNDRLYGGAGADQFDFTDFASGRARIEDFSTRGGDRIILPGNDDYNSLAEVMAVAVERNGNTILNLWDDFVIVLTGVAKSDLSADDFFF